MATDNKDTSQVIKTVCGGILKEPESYPSASYRGEVVYFCTRACRRIFEQDQDAFMAGDVEHPLDEDELGEENMETTFKDPVCDMDVTPETAAGKSEYKGQTYYFCSLGCKKSFDKEPEKYIGKSEDEHTHHH